MVEYIIRFHNIKPSLLFYKELLLVIIPLIFHRTSGKKKNPSANAGDARDSGSIPRSGRSLQNKWQPTPVFLPEKFHGQRSLVGYSPWGPKESDMTEQK